MYNLGNPNRGIMKTQTTSTGFTEKIDNFEDKIPEFDSRSGDHFWIITGAWKINPVKWISGEAALLDHESLVTMVGPGCFYCEKIYSPQLLHRRCKGLPDD